MKKKKETRAAAAENFLGEAYSCVPVQVSVVKHTNEKIVEIKMNLERKPRTKPRQPVPVATNEVEVESCDCKY